MAQVRCGKCGQTFSAYAGGETLPAMCPECGTVLALAGQSPGVVPGQFTAGPSAAEIMAAHEQGPRPGDVQPRRSGAGMSISALLLGMLGVIPCFCFIPSVLAILLGTLACLKDAALKPVAAAGLLLGLFGVIVNGFCMVPLIEGYHESQHCQLCAQGMKEAAASLAAYRRNHNDEFPATLAALEADTNVRASALACPAQPGGKPAIPYAYAPPVDKADLQAIVMCDAVNRHVDKRSVLYASGKFVSLEEDKFQQALAEPQNANIDKELIRRGGGRLDVLKVPGPPLP